MAVEIEIGSSHYNIHIRVERVDHMQTPAKEYVRGSAPEPAGRKVTDLATITVKGDELEGLKRKVSQHLELVDDISVIDERSDKKYRES